MNTLAAATHDDMGGLLFVVFAALLVGAHKLMQVVGDAQARRNQRNMTRVVSNRARATR